MQRVKVPFDHTKVGHLYIVCDAVAEWHVYRLEERGDDSDSPLFGILVSSFPHEMHDKREAEFRAIEYATFACYGGQRGQDAKFSLILNRLTQLNSKLTTMEQDIQAKFDELNQKLDQDNAAFKAVTDELATTKQHVADLETQLNGEHAEIIAALNASIDKATQAATPVENTGSSGEQPTE